MSFSLDLSEFGQSWPVFFRSIFLLLACTNSIYPLTLFAQNDVSHIPEHSVLSSDNRASSAAVDGIAHAEQIMGQLEQVGDWDFCGNNAREIADKIRKQFRFNVWVAEDFSSNSYANDQLDKAGLHHGITAADAITLTLAPLDLSWSISHGSLIIALDGDSRFEQSCLFIHDVTFAFEDLVDQGTVIDASLIRVFLEQIKTLNSPEQWDDSSGDSSIQHLPYVTGRVLIAVKGPGPLQRQIRSFLNRLETELKGTIEHNESLGGEDQPRIAEDQKPHASHGNESGLRPNTKTLSVSTNQLTEEISRNNRYSLRCFQQVIQAKPQNTVLSGLNLREILALMAAGAEGEIRADILKELEWSGTAEVGFRTLTSLRKSLTFSLNTIGKSPLTIKSGLWLDRSIQASEPTENILKRYFGVRPQTVDFSQYSATQELVNKWVETETDGLIDELMPAAPRSDLLPVFFGCNIVHFQSNWETPFTSRNTAPRPFHTSTTEIIEVPTMSEMVPRAGYVDFQDVRVLDLPLKDRRFRLLLVLPPATQDLQTFVANLTLDQFQIWQRSTKKQTVNVQIPKLKWRFSKKEITNAIDGLSLFSRNHKLPINFSGFGAPECNVLLPLLVTALEMDEDGLKAASAAGVTGGFGGAGNANQVSFVADRPFLFFVFDDHTKCLILIGCCLNPLDSGE